MFTIIVQQARATFIILHICHFSKKYTAFGQISWLPVASFGYFISILGVFTKIYTSLFWIEAVFRIFESCQEACRPNISNNLGIAHNCHHFYICTKFPDEGIREGERRLKMVVDRAHKEIKNYVISFIPPF